MADTSSQILAALGNGGEWVSSARMVEDLGVSRMAVCKQVRRLRGLGYGIASSPRRGYRLARRTNRAVPEEVAPLLRSRVIGRPYLYFPEIDSTNLYLRSRADALPEGAAVAADAQTRGRGRFQREWFSPPGGNLYLSVLLKPAVPPFLAPQLSLVAAAAVLRALHALGCEEAGAKWPNDILWRGRKLSGILCEMDAESDVVRAVVVGIGMNINIDAFPSGLKRTAVSLRTALGRPASAHAVAAGILNRLDTEYATWRRDGLRESVRLLNRHSVLAGREAAVELPHGKIRGRAGEITDTGMLRVIAADGAVRDVASGEVRLCRSAAAGRGART